MTYSIIIPKDLDKELTAFAKERDRAKSYLIREAIVEYIEKLKENKEDLEDALKALKDDRPNISWEQVQRNNGLLEN